MTIVSSRSLRMLILSVVLLNLTVCIITGLGIHSSHEQHLFKARADARNLSQVLQQNIDGTLDKIGTVLYSSALEVERQLASGGIDKNALDRYLSSQHKNIPRANSLYMADAAGDILYGSNLPGEPARNIAQRDYFKVLRDSPDKPSFISDPLVGRFSGKRVIVFTRRINTADGSFAGVIMAPISTDIIASFFSSLSLGSKGSVSLRKGFDDFAIIVRYPENLPGTTISATGNTQHSSTFADLVARGEVLRVYEAVTGVDKIYRTFSVRRLDNYNYYVGVGLAHEDVFASWRTESLKMLTVAGIFLLTSLLFALRIARYIAGQEKHHLELEKIANYDALTGLPNRRLLSDRLHHGIAYNRRSGTMMAVCYLDLDDFKPVNDRCGHDVGDKVLLTMASRIRQELREEDTLARLGGDEFVILLTSLERVDEIYAVLNRVLAAVRIPVATQQADMYLSASIGVALFPDDDVDPDTLLRHADHAMYLAKGTSKNCYRLFDQENDKKIQLLRTQQQQLRGALQNDELVLYFQPKVDMLSGEVVGAEALIRWQHPERGLLSPGQFFHYIDDVGLEIAIGEWVLASVLQQKVAWSAAGIAISISANISADHLLHADFVERLRVVLQHYPTVQPDQIELEILETVAISDMNQAARILKRCHDAGVKIALDDFGTGYSSLTYLRNLPVDILKIDQSFIRNMQGSAEDFAIVVSVVQLAKAFNRKVIAEGVETLEQGASLLRIGCRFMQGYAIARPMPAAEMAEWIAKWQTDAVWRNLGE